MKIRTRATLLGMLPALLVAGLLGVFLSTSRLADLEDNLHARAWAMARHLAQGAQYGLVSGNDAAVRRLLRHVLEEPDVVYVAVYGRSGAVFADQGRLPEAIASTLFVGESRVAGYVSRVVSVELPEIDLDDPLLSESPWPNPRESARQRVGWVRVVASRAGNERAARQMLLTGLGITLLGLVFAWLLVRRLAMTGVRPIMETIAAVRQIASGNLDARLPVTAKSELKILQEDVNAMSAALRELRRDMRGQVEAATAELAARKEAAERADQAKSRFLAAASHDLRQPLHAISLFVEALKPQLAGRSAAELLGRIEVSVVSLESLFNAILDVTHLDAGAVVPRSAPIDVAAFLARLREEFIGEAEQRGLTLRARCAPGLACVADPLLLERILRNLLSNALRYTSRGGVLLSARRHCGMARIQVWDTGKGIASEEWERVFEEFYQVDNPHRDRARGLGLGLSIVKRLADLLECGLELRSIPGRGSVFSLAIPIRAANEHIPDLSEPPVSSFVRLEGRIWVVDDDQESREALDALLRGWGLEVETAVGSEEAMARFRSPAAVLLTDFHLERENGLDVARILGEAFPVQPFSTVVMTADTSTATAALLREAGVAVMHKPLRPAKLRALLERLCRERARDGGGERG